MSAVAILAGKLEQQPNALHDDLSGAVDFMDALMGLFGAVHHEIFIDNAVIQLTHSSGHSVGHITFDSEVDSFRFIPHQNTKEED